MKEIKWGKEGIGMKAIMWDISGFTVPCANPDKIYFFSFYYQGKQYLSSLKKHWPFLIAPLLSQHLVSISVATTHFLVP